MNRPTRGVMVVVIFAACLCLPLAGPDRPRADADAPRTLRSAANSVKHNPVALTSLLIRQGLKLAPWATLLEANARLHASVDLSPRGATLRIDLSLGDAINEVEGRIREEKNDQLRQQLQVMLDRLKEDRERNRLLEEQNRLTRSILDLQVRAFAYQKWVQEEAVLRKSRYDVPADKLVVVVADFSSGNPDEGREVADEIAHHLKELTKHGVDIYLMTGEVKPGVVVRSPEMARDVGRHFPTGTDFAVIWGSMSPRTVGRYRPHLTSVQHLKGNLGASITTSLELTPEELPEKGKEEAYQRECYQRLIGATCATIPSLYAAHRIAREETPKMDGFFKFLGEDTAEAKEFREKLEPLVRWTQAREARKEFPLRRLSDITSASPYPLTIANEKDGGLMTLITDEKGQPCRFRNKETGKDEIVYIDTLETSTAQFVRFLNENKEGNKKDSGVRWLLLEPSFSDIAEAAGGAFTARDADKIAKRRSVCNVNWFGARAYCKWAGKALPREEEWVAAARPAGGGAFPWGAEGKRFTELCNAGDLRANRPGGEFDKDRSRVGCFDMGGNVAEWCEDWFDPKDPVSKRTIKGGSFLDKVMCDFEVGSRRPGDQVSHYRWVGFRGVVRIPVEAAK